MDKKEIADIVTNYFFRKGYHVKSLDINLTETIAYVTAQYTANKNNARLPECFKLDYIDFMKTSIVGFVLLNSEEVKLMQHQASKPL